MGVEVIDLALTNTGDYSSETQSDTGGPGSSKRRANPFRGGYDLSGNVVPSGVGSGTGGMNIKGDHWYLTVGGNLDIGFGSEFFPADSLMMAKVDGASSGPDFAMYKPTTATVSVSPYRDPYDASGDVYPSSGGSGSGGTIARGDIFPVSVGGSLDITGLGVTPINPDALLIAKVNNPTNSAADWIVKQ